MRYALLAALLAAPATAAADGTSPASHLSGKYGQDFWGYLVEPHRAEVDLILRKAGSNKLQALQSSPYDWYQGYDPARAQLKRQLLGDAEGMLRHALRLAPENPAVLRELALVTDENDRAIAREYLERYLAAEVPERITAEARVRLGRWYGRERRWSEAILQLRLALGGRPPDPRTAVFGRILLAEAYMQTGRLAEAIDLLRGSLSSTPPHIYPPDYTTPFALAVAYDRDEQITLAHETLERLAGLAPDAISLVLSDHQGQKTPLVPLEERHYFAALQYEVLGHLAESRAEWLAYLGWKDAPYRERARQHLVEVEMMLRAETASRARPPAATPSPYAPFPLGVP